MSACGNLTRRALVVAIKNQIRLNGDTEHVIKNLYERLIIVDNGCITMAVNGRGKSGAA